MADVVQATLAKAGAAPVVTGVETEAAKAAQKLADVVRQTEVAAREWGVRPDHLEGRFVSALMATLTWLGRLIQAAMTDLRASTQETRAASVIELEKLRLANEVSTKVLGQAKQALLGAEVEQRKLLGQVVAAAAPQLIAAIGAAVVIRERRYNTHLQWGRAAGIAALALALLGGGYVWGGWQSPSVTAGAVALERIRQCEADPVKDARTSEAFCPLRKLLPPV